MYDVYTYDSLHGLCFPTVIFGFDGSVLEGVLVLTALGLDHCSSFTFRTGKFYIRFEYKYKMNFSMSFQPLPVQNP